MSRFGYDDYDPEFPNQGELWWANIYRHIGGKKGQEALREIRATLLAMPEKRLIRGRLADEQGGVCLVGAVAVARRIAAGERKEDVLRELALSIQDDDYYGGDVTACAGVRVGLKYGLAWALGDLNDETLYNKTPEERWTAALAWVESKIHAEDAISHSRGEK